ncbi:MAG: VanZ family protein [Paludibacteraceae bacterium]|nr:VanZ family protein [Paludibacteraceae bacterium]
MKLLRTYPISLIVGVGIALLLLLPVSSGDMSSRIPNADKYVHAFLFLLLSFAMSFESSRAVKGRYPFVGYVCCIFIPLVWGALMEFAQHFLSYRSGSWWDFVADGIGVAMGFALGYVWFISECKSE